MLVDTGKNKLDDVGNELVVGAMGVFSPQCNGIRQRRSLLHLDLCKMSDDGVRCDMNVGVKKLVVGIFI